jgi:hypothetical protein
MVVELRITFLVAGGVVEWVACVGMCCTFDLNKYSLVEVKAKEWHVVLEFPIRDKVFLFLISNGQSTPPHFISSFQQLTTSQVYS